MASRFLDRTLPRWINQRGRFSFIPGGLPVLPPGYVFLVDTDGAYLVDTDGAYLVEQL